MTKKRNILMITPYIPRLSQSGGQNSSYYSIKYLSKNNHITLICFSRDHLGLKDIKKFFKAGYILLCTINPYILQNKKGYFSHLVLITDLNTKEKIIKFHDPGLSPQKNKKTPLNLFL